MRLLFVENNATFASVVIEEFLAPDQVTLMPEVAHALTLDLGEFDVVLCD